MLVLIGPIKDPGAKRVTGEYKHAAVIAAVGAYKEPSWKLRGPINDAQRLGMVLSTSYNIPADRIKYLLDADATRLNIINALTDFVTRYDEVIFSWSGHGTQVFSDTEDDWKEEVLVTYDHSWSNLLTGDDIREVLSRAKKSWVILDCCHAQGASRNGRVVKSLPMLKPRKMKLIKTARAFDNQNITELAGCMSNQLSFEWVYDNKWHGAFTHHLCNILEESPEIPLDQLQYELRKRIVGQMPIISPTSNTPVFRALVP